MNDQQFQLCLPPRLADDVLRDRIARIEAELREHDCGGTDAIELAREADRLRALLGDRREAL